MRHSLIFTALGLGLLAGPASSGPISITSRSAMVSGMVSDFSGADAFASSAPGGIADVMLSDSASTPALHTSAGADVTAHFDSNAIASIGGGMAGTSLPGGVATTSATAELHVFFDLTSAALLSWDFGFVHLAPAGSVDVVFKEAGGATFAIGTHSLAAGSYEIHAVATFTDTHPPALVTHSSHYTLSLMNIVPLPSAALLGAAGLGACSAVRRRR